MGAKFKHDIGTEGANAEYAAHYMKDWRQSQKKSVGRGWAKAKATTAAKFSRRFNAMQNVSIMRTNAARGQCEAALIMLGVSGWQRS